MDPIRIRIHNTLVCTDINTLWAQSLALCLQRYFHIQYFIVYSYTDIFTMVCTDIITGFKHNLSHYRYLYSSLTPNGCYVIGYAVLYANILMVVMLEEVLYSTLILMVVMLEDVMYSMLIY